MGNPISVTSAGGVASSETSTVSGTWTGAVGSAIAKSNIFEKIGNIVVFTISSEVSGAAAGGGNSFTFSNSVAASLRPNISIEVPVVVKNGGLEEIGVLTVNSATGAIEVFAAGKANFGTTSTNGIKVFSVSWVV
jgi:hypothetical protein